MKPMCFEEFGFAITNKGELLPCCYCDSQKTLNDPDFKKLTTTYFHRVSTWMYIFMHDLKFESGGPAAIDSGAAALSVPLIFLSLFFSTSISAPEFN